MTDMTDFALKYRYKYPLLKTFWYPNPTFIRCHYYYVLMTIFCLVIPTNIFEFFVDLLGIKLP